MTVDILRRVITVDDERLAKRAARGLVSVVDDDPSVLLALQTLIEYEGYACTVHASVSEFLTSLALPRFPGPRCILSDTYMPEIGGLQFQESMPVDSDQPIIFMSGMAQIEDAAQAFRRGAIHFLNKPIKDSELFVAIDEALQLSAQLQFNRSMKKIRAERIARLSPRERELAKLLPAGLQIKEMAEAMGISERAIKLYKKNLTEKLEIQSVFELVDLQRDGLL